jgi:Effector-associated domain 1/Trypsin-like peptidase domain
VSTEDAERRLRAFERGHRSELVELASHAALPVVLNPDFVHLLRVNYFLDPPVTLPYAAEAELLLSQLCTEIDDGLYAIDPDLRDVLLQRLVRQHNGTGRLRDVARLLWEYGQRSAPWPDRPGLPEAQQLSALNFIDPQRAQRWLARAEETAGTGAAADERWFVAVRQDLADRGAAVQRAEEETAEGAGPQAAAVLVENGRMATPPPEWQALEEHREQIEAAATSLCLIATGETREDNTLTAVAGFLAGRRVVLTTRSIVDRLRPQPSASGQPAADEGVGVWLAFPHHSRPVGGSLPHSRLVGRLTPAQVTRVELLAGSNVCALLLAVEAADESALPAPLAVASAPPADPVGRQVYSLSYAQAESVPTDWETGTAQVYRMETSMVPAVWPGAIVSAGIGGSAGNTLIIHDCPPPPGSAGSPLIDLATGQALGMNAGGLTLVSPLLGRMTTQATALWPDIHERVLALEAQALGTSTRPGDAIGWDYLAFSPRAEDEMARLKPTDERPERDLPLGDDDINALLYELSQLFSDEQRAASFLRAVRYPARLIPSWTDAFDFWASIFEALDRGFMEVPYRRLIDAALRVYSGNPVLQDLRARGQGAASPDATAGPAVTPQTVAMPIEPTCHLVLRMDSEDERADAEAWLHDQGLNPQLQWSSATAVSFRLSEQDPHVVSEIMRSRPDIGWTLVPPGQPDYLLRQIFVQGPDGRSFRFSDVPASATVGSVAAELVEQYPDDMPGRDRPTIVDFVGPDGAGRRTDPDKSLHEEGVTEGSRLRVAREPEEAHDDFSPADINRLIYEMSLLFGARTAASAFLRAAGFPAELIPAWPENAYQFWASIFEALDRGVITAPYHRLISAARRRYPANAVLDDLHRRYPEPGAPGSTTEQPSAASVPGSAAILLEEPGERPRSLYVTGPDGQQLRITDVPSYSKISSLRPEGLTRESPDDLVQKIKDLTQKIAGQDPEGLPGGDAPIVVDVMPTENAAAEAAPDDDPDRAGGDEDSGTQAESPSAQRPASASADTVCHLVVFCPPEERTDIAGWLSDQGHDPEEVWSTSHAVSFRLNQTDPSVVTAFMQARPDLSWSVVSPGQPDYLLPRLSVEGPDGRSFRLRNVPSSLMTSAVARTVIDQYPEGLPGGGSPLVVDVVGPDGAGQRINPDMTLDEEAVADGSRLRIGFQRRAA